MYLAGNKAFTRSKVPLPSTYISERLAIDSFHSFVSCERGSSGYLHNQAESDLGHVAAGARVFGVIRAVVIAGGIVSVAC